MIRTSKSLVYILDKSDDHGFDRRRDHIMNQADDYQSSITASIFLNGLPNDKLTALSSLFRGHGLA
jgi:hypothetical protein